MDNQRIRTIPLVVTTIVGTVVCMAVSQRKEEPFIGNIIYGVSFIVCVFLYVIYLSNV